MNLRRVLHGRNGHSPAKAPVPTIADILADGIDLIELSLAQHPAKVISAEDRQEILQELIARTERAAPAAVDAILDYRSVQHRVERHMTKEEREPRELCAAVRRLFDDSANLPESQLRFLEYSIEPRDLNEAERQLLTFSLVNPALDRTIETKDFAAPSGGDELLAWAVQRLNIPSKPSYQEGWTSFSFNLSSAIEKLTESERTELQQTASQAGLCWEDLISDYLEGPSIPLGCALNASGRISPMQAHSASSNLFIHLTKGGSLSSGVQARIERTLEQELESATEEHNQRLEAKPSLVPNDTILDAPEESKQERPAHLDL